MADNNLSEKDREKEIRARLQYGLKNVLPRLVPLIHREFPKDHRLISPYDNTIQPDLDAEEEGISAIRSRYPADSIVAEESAKRGEKIKGESDYGWIADFIDGSSNFRKKKPHFAINMSVKKGDEVLGGIICDPMKYRIFYTRKGAGFFLDGEKLSLYDKPGLARRLSDAHLGLISPNSFRKHREYGLMQRLQKAAGSKIAEGSTSLELAACAAGEVDGVVKPTSNPWGVSAGLLMVEEAGGKVTPIDRGPHTIYVASNPYIHEELCDVVRDSA
ncbi:inositol monophosphatase [Candidatus Woesearchaeota archaeon]|nr:inositol monophosphatase [Candidatus Woesearchaeota archaeon]